MDSTDSSDSSVTGNGDTGTGSAADALRAGLARRLLRQASAWSVTGRDVGFVTGFDHGLEIGGFATITIDDGTRLVAQVHELRLGEREAVHLGIATDGIGPDGAVQRAEVGLNLRYVAGSGEVLAALTDDGVAAFAPAGFTDAEIEPAEGWMVDAVVARSLGSAAGLPIGTATAGAAARVKSSGFSRHTFLVGQSGSGKTYTLGVLLERLLLHTSLPMVVIDPNSDSVHLGQLLPRERVHGRGEPPMDEVRYAALADGVAASGRVMVASAGSDELPLRIHLSDLAIDEQAVVLGVDPRRDADEFGVFMDVADQLAESGHYGLDRMIERLGERTDNWSQRLHQRIHNRRLTSWRIWAAHDEASITSMITGFRALVLDTGSLDEADEKAVIALATLGALHRRPQRRSVLLVIDEAHNLLSPDLDDPLCGAVAGHGTWIAAEGRKYGVHLLLSTQRPQKIRRNILSQCDNLVLMRMNSKVDIDDLATVFSHVPGSMMAEATAFQQGEMLMAGPIAPTPLRVQVAERWCAEGGADLPTDWATSGALDPGALS